MAGRAAQPRRARLGGHHAGERRRDGPGERRLHLVHRRVAAVCGFDSHRANTLLDDGSALLGRVGEPVLDRSAKLAALRELAAANGLGMADCLAVGDGANDLDMIRAAGLGVAYHAKPIVAGEARVQVEHSGLRALLFMQGYAADAFAN